MQHLRLVGTIPRGTEALDRADSWTPWCRVCTRLAREHPANVARYGVVATSLGRTYGYRLPHGLRHSTLVAVCWSSLSVHPPRLCCSSQCMTRRKNVWVWPQILCQVRVESRDSSHWSTVWLTNGYCPFIRGFTVLTWCLLPFSSLLIGFRW